MRQVLVIDARDIESSNSHGTQ